MKKNKKIISILLLIQLITVNCGNDESKESPQNPQITIDSKNNIISTFTGGRQGDDDGTLDQSSFSFINGMCKDNLGNLYVVNSTGAFGNTCKLKKITPDGTVTTIVGSEYGNVDGPASTAKITIGSICCDNVGNIYGLNLNKIKKITSNGTVSTWCGNDSGYVDGSLSTAKFKSLTDICRDNNGNFYVIDDFKIRKISFNGQVTTIAGSISGDIDNVGTNAQLNPFRICYNPHDDCLYVTEAATDKVKQIKQNGEVTTYYDGSYFFNSNYDFGSLNSPHGIDSDTVGNIFIAGFNNADIIKITPQKKVMLYAGLLESPGFLTPYTDGPGDEATFGHPDQIKVLDNSTLFISDNDYYVIRKGQRINN